MASMKQIHRELAELIRVLDSTFAGQVILPEEPLQQSEEGGVLSLQFAVKPSGGIYKDCRVRFKIYLSDDYPNEKPDIMCMDTVAHPNFAFDSDGSDCGSDSNVCVSILDDWRDGDCHRDLSSVVQAVLFLFYNPEVDDALVPVGDMDDLENLVEATKRGIGDPTEYCEFPGIVFTSIYEGPVQEATEEQSKTTQPGCDVTTPTESGINVVDKTVTSKTEAELEKTRQMVDEHQMAEVSEMTDYREQNSSSEVSSCPLPTVPPANPPAEPAEEIMVAVISDVMEEVLMMTTNMNEHGTPLQASDVMEETTSASVVVVRPKDLGHVTDVVDEVTTAESVVAVPNSDILEDLATVATDVSSITDGTTEESSTIVSVGQGMAASSLADGGGLPSGGVSGELNYKVFDTNTLSRKVIRKVLYSFWRRLRQLLS